MITSFSLAWHFFSTIKYNLVYFGLSERKKNDQNEGGKSFKTKAKSVKFCDSFFVTFSPVGS